MDTKKLTVRSRPDRLFGGHFQLCKQAEGISSAKEGDIVTRNLNCTTMLDAALVNELEKYCRFRV